jgi:2-hydroxy-6-oxonona-2,4-dienedioate hydrolase
MRMSFIDADGVRIRYELLGSGPLLVLTPGGRFPMDVPGLRELADRLAAAYTVMLWDRPNCGDSDVAFGGSSESQLWAGTLATVIRQLGLGPAVLTGGSAGARLSLQTAIDYPEVVSAVAVWWISGGVYGSFSLGANYVLSTLEAAHRGGMAAVAQVPHWAERIARNPRNEQLIKGFDRADFIAIMERWLESFSPNRGGPVAGLADEEISTLAGPLLIVHGDPLDYNHPEFVARHVHQLVRGSRYLDSPWPDGEWLRITAAAAAGTAPLFARWELLAPILLNSLADATART